MAQLPLAAGLFNWREEASRQPLISALLTGLYELAVLVIAFGGKVWGRVEDEAAKSLSEWLINRARSFAPGFRRRYYERVIRDHNIFNVSGLSLIRSFRLALEQVFVELRVDPSNSRTLNIDPVAQREVSGNRPIWDFLRWRIGQGHGGVALAIVGPPGSGKTTLLKHLAITQAAGRQARYGARALTPVLLFLRDHVEAVLAGHPSLGDLLQTHYGDRKLYSTLKPPQGWFERRLAKGKCLVLLDGLDEVADVQSRQAMSAWVDSQVANYPGCAFVLTARPLGYLDAPLERADMVLEVMPFNAEQVRKFIRNWYVANEIINSPGQPVEVARERAEQSAEDLWSRLSSAPGLSALTVNPLLLTMIAMVHSYRGALPGNRVGLYAEICEVLLERWRQTRQVKERLPLRAAQKLTALRPLAAHMMVNRLRDVSTEEVLRVIDAPLKRVGIPSEDALTFIADLQANSGLFLEREPRQWSFAHLTFQEYLTSVHWREQSDTAPAWEGVIDDSWWHETMRLYAAQGDATDLVRTCLDMNSLPALALAADFLEEGREILPAVRAEAEQIVEGGLYSADPARRQFASEVRLSRRIRNLKPLDEHREIDLEFITCAEYQLFLDEMQADGRYYQPEHWATPEYPHERALDPVTGVYPEDAEAFCGWLNLKHRGVARYRLPLTDEALSFPLKNAKTAAWCKGKGRYEVVGLSSEYENKINATLAASDGSGWQSLPTNTSVVGLAAGVSANEALLPELKDLLEAEATRVAASSEQLLDSDAAPDANKLGRLIERFLATASNGIMPSQILAAQLMMSVGRTYGRHAPEERNNELTGLAERIREVAEAPRLQGHLTALRDIRQHRQLDLVFAAKLALDVRDDLRRASKLACEMAGAVSRREGRDLIAPAAFEVANILTVDVVLIGVIKSFLAHSLEDVMRLTRELLGEWAEPTRLQAVWAAYDQPQGFYGVTPARAAKGEFEIETLRFLIRAQPQVEHESGRVRGRRWFKTDGGHGGVRDMEKSLGDFLAWSRVLRLRESDDLDAWEGIRIVRDDSPAWEGGGV